MKKRLLIVLITTIIASALCACGEESKKPETTPAVTKESMDTSSEKPADSGTKVDIKETAGSEPSKEVTNSGKYYKLYELVEGYDIGNTGFIRLDCDPEGGYVQFDLSEWLQANTFFSTDYLPKDGEYFATTYDYGGGEPSRDKIYLEYSDNTIVIFFYSNEVNLDTGNIELVRQGTGSKFKLVEDSRNN